VFSGVLYVPYCLPLPPRMESIGKLTFLSLFSCVFVLTSFYLPVNLTSASLTAYQQTETSYNYKHTYSYIATYTYRHTYTDIHVLTD